MIFPENAIFKKLVFVLLVNRLIKIKEWVDKNDPGATIIPFSGAFEHKLLEFEDPVLRKKYLEDNNATRYVY